ncbi:MAG: hypothetical protein U5J82_03450 [Desulfobacterales bacterium]|nr:hypothetical protein [Desulfobacterales bacterium]
MSTITVAYLSARASWTGIAEGYIRLLEKMGFLSLKEVGDAL